MVEYIVWSGGKSQDVLPTSREKNYNPTLSYIPRTIIVCSLYLHNSPDSYNSVRYKSDIYVCDERGATQQKKILLKKMKYCFL